MSNSVEYRTVVSCVKQLEVALKSCDRDLVHFLHQEGFIKEEVYDEVLSPRLLNDHQKAGELVTGIRNKVELSTQSYHTLLDHFRQGGKLYEGIVKILDEEYCSRQQQTGIATQDLEYRSDLNEVILRYQSYLKSYYKIHYLPKDDKLSITPCNKFLSLTLVYSNKESESVYRSETSSSMTKSDLLEFIMSRTLIEIDSIVKPEFKFVLVEGHPGIGKSTLCWELCRKWDTLKSLQCYKIVLLLKLRERRVQSATTLTDIFFHRDKELSQHVAKKVLECEGEGVLLVLDGLDEMPKPIISDKNSLIMELISGKCLPKTTRILTSRPSALCKELPNQYRRVEILGFTDECIIQFARNAFESEADLLAQFNEIVMSNPITKSLLYIPINCAIIVQVYKDIRRSRKLMPKTMTQLYTTLVLVLIRRHMIEKGEWNDETKFTTSLQLLPDDILTSLSRVGKLAYQGLFEKDTQLVFSDEDVGENFQHLGLLSETKEMYVLEGAKSSYAFSHRSMQEFLATWYVSRDYVLVNKISEKYFPISEYSSIPLFLIFLAGHVVGKEIPEKLTSDAKFMLHCFHEAQDPKKYEELLNLSKELSLTGPFDIYAFGYALVHAPIQWETTLFVPLDMLARSIAIYAPSGKLNGSISNLFVCNMSKYFHNLLKQIESLPNTLLESVVNLQVELQINMPCSEDEESVFYKSLKSFSKIKQLWLYFRDITPKGMIELSKLIRNSSELECVIMEYMRYITPQTFKNPLQADLQDIVSAALLCPTVKKLLLINIPFKPRSIQVESKIEHIEFGTTFMGFWMSEDELKESLFSLADFCKLPRFKTLKVNIGSHSIICEYSPILDNMVKSFRKKLLQRNPSMNEPVLKGKIFQVY